MELSLGSAIRKIKEKSNLTNKELSSLIGFSERSLNNYIAGKTPSKSDSEKIGNYIKYKNLDIFELLDLDGEEFLFHGSRNGIIGKITTQKNINKRIDFGSGFYLSESFKTAVTYVDNRDNPHIYRFKKSQLSKSRLFSFTESIDDVKSWVLFIGLNRGKIINDNEKTLFSLFFDSYFKNYSLLIGKIADSFNFDVMESFFAGDYDVLQVNKALRQVEIGNQIVIKDEKLANSLVEYDEYTLDKNLKSFILEWHKAQTENNKKYNKDGIDKKTAISELKFDQIVLEYKEKYEKLGN